MSDTYVVCRLMGVHKMYMMEILDTLQCLWVDDPIIANHYLSEETATIVSDTLNGLDEEFTITLERYINDNT